MQEQGEWTLETMDHQMCIVRDSSTRDRGATMAVTCDHFHGIYQDHLLVCPAILHWHSSQKETRHL